MVNGATDGALGREALHGAVGQAQREGGVGGARSARRPSKRAWAIFSIARVVGASTSSSRKRRVSRASGSIAGPGRPSGRSRQPRRPRPPSRSAWRAATSRELRPRDRRPRRLGRRLPAERRPNERVLGAQLVEGELELVGEGRPPRGPRGSGPARAARSGASRGSRPRTPRSASRSASSPRRRTGRSLPAMPSSCDPSKPTSRASMRSRGELLLDGRHRGPGVADRLREGGVRRHLRAQGLLLLRPSSPSPSRRGARRRSRRSPSGSSRSRRSGRAPAASAPRRGPRRRAGGQPALEHLQAERPGLVAQVLEARHRLEPRRRARVAGDEHEVAVAHPLRRPAQRTPPGATGLPPS